MSNSSTTRLYGGIDRSSHSQISNCTIPTAFVGMLGILRFAREGFSLDPYGIVLFGAAAILH